MVPRDTLITFITSCFSPELLREAAHRDDLANGIQILGGSPVSLVTLGVTLNEEFLNEARLRGSNFCITHHGLDVRTYKSRLSLSYQKRLRTIFQNNFTVLGYHYALDAHPRIGNNATIIQKLGAKVREPFFETWGFVAEFPSPQDVQELAKKCSQIINHEVFTVFSGPKRVKTLGVVSGAAKPYAEHLAEMEEKGVELLITGETSESIPARMKEAEVNYFVCGHYATEVFGVQELGKLITAQFKDKVQVEFVDIPNPI